MKPPLVERACPPRTENGRPARIRVFLVDDHPPRAAIRLAQVYPARKGTWRYDAEAEDVQRGRDSDEQAMPDIVSIADISLQKNFPWTGTGKRTWRSRIPALPVAGASMQLMESLDAERVLRAGAKGYITKQEATKKILLALRQVLGGQIYVSRKNGHPHAP